MNLTYTALIALLRAGSIRPVADAPALNDAASTQFSVRLRPESRIFFDDCAGRMGISRAALFSMLADGMRDDTADRAVSLYERFCLLMDAHGLDVGTGPVTESMGLSYQRAVRSRTHPGRLC
ncbi:TPA: hypothetical protein G8O67_003170 [Salmonella enterica]|uniref:Uncharacterized protein n=1 Tax=Salmonella enterica TaxID=28901 RepID=A0A756I0C4_SALER|nr:hypothetical protein [Salmonella enterica]